MQIIEQTPDKLILQTHIEWFVYPLLFSVFLIALFIYLNYFYTSNDTDFYSQFYKSWLPYFCLIFSVPFIITAELTTYEFDKSINKLTIKRQFAYKLRIEEYPLDHISDINMGRIFLSNRTKIIMNLKEFADIELSLSKPWARDIDKLVHAIRNFLGV